MKHFFFLFAALFFSTITIAQQFPLENFDQSRCHFAKTVKLPVQQYPLEYLPNLNILHKNGTPLPYSFWQWQNQQAIFLKEDMFTGAPRLLIPKPGRYFFVVLDSQKASLVVINALEPRLEIQFFYHCAMHY